MYPIENGLGYPYSIIEFGSLTHWVHIKWTQDQLLTQYDTCKERMHFLSVDYRVHLKIYCSSHILKVKFICNFFTDPTVSYVPLGRLVFSHNFLSLPCDTEGPLFDKTILPMPTILATVCCVILNINNVE